MEGKTIIQLTEDGSHTIYSEIFDSTYHSTHGAVQESMHVFIEHGLNYYVKNKESRKIKVLEYGFGTGLNALLAYEYSYRNRVEVEYFGLEAYPIDIEEVNMINYLNILNMDNKEDMFIAMHNEDDIDSITFSKYFTFSKEKVLFEEFQTKDKFDIIFFDAFSPDVQSHLWERPFLDSVYDILNIGGVFITYGAKGAFKRALKSLGFKVQNPPGPPGKREITRGIKSENI